MSVWVVEYYVQVVLLYALLIGKAWAVADVLGFRKQEYFAAADKQSKVFWAVVLVLTLAVQWFVKSPLSVFNLIGDVVVFVYFADVRPTLRSMRQH